MNMVNSMHIFEKLRPGIECSIKFGQVSSSPLLYLSINKRLNEFLYLFIVMNVFVSDVNKLVISELIARSGPLWNMFDR